MAEPTYLYRCTEQQLDEHLERLAEDGQIVEHVVYKGGRDYVLVCRRPGPDNQLLVELRAIRELLDNALGCPQITVYESANARATAAEVARLSSTQGGA